MRCLRLSTSASTPSHQRTLSTKPAALCLNFELSLRSFSQALSVLEKSPVRSGNGARVDRNLVMSKDCPRCNCRSLSTL